MAIYISDWTLEKGNYSDISTTLIHRSELTAIPGDAKCCHVLPLRVRTHRGQVINGGQSHCGPNGPMVNVSPDLECIIGTDILGSWSNLHSRSLDSELEVLRVGMAKWKPVPKGHNCESKNITTQNIGWRLVPLLKNSFV